MLSRVLSNHSPETKLLSIYREQNKPQGWLDFFREFWSSLGSTKGEVVKRTLRLSKKKNLKIQATLLKEFPHLSPTLQLEAAKTHLLYFVNHKKDPKSLPSLVKAAKNELIAQFPMGKEAFNERFILKELKARVREVKAESMRNEIVAFSDAEKGGGKNIDAFKYIQNEKSVPILAKLLRNKPELKAKLDKELSPLFKIRLKRELEMKPPQMKGRIIKKGAKIPASDFTVLEEALDYPVNSATEHQAKIDYSRSPRIFIDGKYHSFPNGEKLFRKIEKKYGKLAALLITQGKLDAMERFLSKQLNPEFPDFVNFNILGQHLMTYAIESKGEMVQFTYKICKEVRDSEKLEEGPVFYAPIEQTLLIPLRELKNGVIKTAETSIKIHDSVSTLGEAHRVLRLPSLTALDASKFVENYNQQKEYLDAAVSLLINSENFESDIAGFLKKVSKKSTQIYQTLLGKMEEALLKQSTLI